MVSWDSETIAFAGVKLERPSFFRAVRLWERGQLVHQPLSLLDTCARKVALELEARPFSIDIGGLPHHLVELITERIFEFSRYQPASALAEATAAGKKRRADGPPAGSPEAGEDEDGSAARPESPLEQDWFECECGECNPETCYGTACCGSSFCPARRAFSWAAALNSALLGWAPEEPAGLDEEEAAGKGQLRLSLWARYLQGGGRDPVYLRVLPNRFHVKGSGYSYNTPAAYAPFDCAPQPATVAERLLLVDAVRLSGVAPLAPSPQLLIFSYCNYDQ